jgi:hypothetical protein
MSEKKLTDHIYHRKEQKQQTIVQVICSKCNILSFLKYNRLYFYRKKHRNLTPNTCQRSMTYHTPEW